MGAAKVQMVLSPVLSWVLSWKSSESLFARRVR